MDSSVSFGVKFRVGTIRLNLLFDKSYPPIRTHPPNTIDLSAPSLFSSHAVDLPTSHDPVNPDRSNTAAPLANPVDSALDNSADAAPAAVTRRRYLIRASKGIPWGSLPAVVSRLPGAEFVSEE
ncbi:hypothetical protein NliqN6_3040 [Naganishia liquefaciens]|uniref:Uncharacterized protein n=1 Tax=Naganishia liquefaciens TaxID=104408 RepID=A0A8H3TT59_9TREE|nr:hypothetical protein NliqN6_3040 [Naganishia liquefaciens]